MRSDGMGQIYQMHHRFPMNLEKSWVAVFLNHPVCKENINNKQGRPALAYISVLGNNFELLISRDNVSKCPSWVAIHLFI